MPEPVIVATARTPIGKAYRGAFNDTQAQELAAHALSHAVRRAGLEGGEVEDVIFGCAVQQHWAAFGCAATIASNTLALVERLGGARSTSSYRLVGNLQVGRVAVKACLLLNMTPNSTITIGRPAPCRCCGHGSRQRPLEETVDEPSPHGSWRSVHRRAFEPGARRSESRPRSPRMNRMNRTNRKQ